MTYDIFKIWLAGFFDGEGCVYMQLDKRQNRNCYGLQVSITQRDISILEEIKRIYGGSVYKSHRRNACYRWRTINKNAEKFLEDIEPYLLLKRSQVVLALEFIKSLRKDNLGCVPITPKEQEIRMGICSKIKELKHCGAEVIQTPAL